MFEIRVLLKHYWKPGYKASAAARSYVKWKEKVSLVSVWHNVSTLEKKTLKIYHVLEDLNYCGILRIYAEFWKKIRKNTRRPSKELGATKDTIHRQIKTLGKSYRSCRSVHHELTSQQPQRIVMSVVSLSAIP